jgi:hypothetical protein
MKFRRVVTDTNKEGKAYVKDLPRRYSGMVLASEYADGHTTSFSRRVVVADDADQLLHSAFDRNRRVRLDELSRDFGETLRLRAKEKLTSREDSDTFDARRSSSSSSRNERVLYTYIHETGHQIYYRAGSPPPPKMKWRAPTGYGETNNDELFAESLSAYTLNPEALRQYDEGLFKWVEDAYTKAMKEVGKPL